MSEHIRFAFRGFSPKRFGYLLDCISFGLLFYHSRADWRGDDYLSEIAAAIMFVNLIFGRLTVPTDKGRYWPFVIALWLLIFHSMLIKL